MTHLHAQKIKPLMRERLAKASFKLLTHYYVTEYQTALMHPVDHPQWAEMWSRVGIIKTQLERRLKGGG